MLKRFWRSRSFVVLVGLAVSLAVVGYVVYPFDPTEESVRFQLPAETSIEVMGEVPLASRVSVNNEFVGPMKWIKFVSHNPKKLTVWNDMTDVGGHSKIGGENALFWERVRFSRPFRVISRIEVGPDHFLVVPRVSGNYVAWAVIVLWFTISTAIFVARPLASMRAPEKTAPAV